MAAGWAQGEEKGRPVGVSRLPQAGVEGGAGFSFLSTLLPGPGGASIKVKQ